MLARLRQFFTRTLQRQLIAGMVLVTGVMMSLFVLDTTRRQQQQDERQQSEEATALAQSLATASASWLASRDLQGLQDVVDGFHLYPDLHYMMVLDLHGQVLAHSDPQRVGLFMNDLPARPGALAQHTWERILDVTAPVQLAGRQVGWARLGLGRESRQETLARVARSGVLYLLIGIGLSVLLAWATARQMLGRLGRIQAVADGVQAGEPGLRVTLQGQDEAAHLAAQFNAMLDTLAEREADLARALGRLRAMTDRVPGVVVLQLQRHADGRLSLAYASEALHDIFRLHPEGLTEDAGALMARFHPDDLPAVRESLQRSAQQLGVWAGEFRVQCPEHPTTWVQINAMPQRQPPGGVQWTGFITDITELKRAQLALYASEKRLQQAVHQLEASNSELKQLNERLVQSQWQLLQSEKMASIGQLAAGVAHEINNPIGFVQSNLGSLERYLELLTGVLQAYRQFEPLLDERARTDTAVAQGLHRLQQARQGEELDDVLEDIPVLLSETREGVVRVRQIVANLRDFSRADRQTQWEWADLRTGLEATLTIAHNEIKYRADVAREYADIPPIHCLPSQLNQVFLNLLVNAAQAMTEGVRGLITVRCGADGETGVWVEVADNGCGIAPDHLPHMFEPFFTTKPAGKGTGLGLSLSMGIVQKHGGRLEVSSTPGAGSVFRLWLPVEPPAAGA